MLLQCTRVGCKFCCIWWIWLPNPSVSNRHWLSIKYWYATIHIVKYYIIMQVISEVACFLQTDKFQILPFVSTGTNYLFFQLAQSPLVYLTEMPRCYIGSSIDYL